jgi:hypothetical protein
MVELESEGPGEHMALSQGGLDRTGPGRGGADRRTGTRRKVVDASYC